MCKLPCVGANPTHFIPLKFLQNALYQAFVKFYPEETAVALSITHAQMHARFARSLGEIPVAEGDVRKVIRGNRVASHFQPHKRGEAGLDPLRGDRILNKPILEQEIVDCIDSLGGHVSAMKLQLELPHLHLSLPTCRKYLRELEKKGLIKRVGEEGKNREVYYSVVEKSSVGDIP
jgi:hypothetical protein